MTQSSLHVAIIMDGNRRWASRSGVTGLEGHASGAESLRRIVEAASGLGIGVLTVYAFSADNWKRPPAEVAGLMLLITRYLETETPHLKANGICTKVIGRRDRVLPDLLEAIHVAEAQTQDCSELEFRLAIDYSARATILEAATDEQRRESFFRDALPVDLLIRTGGEQRLSDFLLWEAAYAELVFTTRMWPEFRPCDLRAAIDEYHRRERRFGGSSTDRSAPHGSSLPQTMSGSAERWLS